MTPLRLKRIRVAILPAAALAAGGVTIWLDARGGDVDRDDLCPAVLTIILSFAALLEYFFRRFWRKSREVQFEHVAEAVTKGFRAGAQSVLGDAQSGQSTQRLP